MFPTLLFLLSSYFCLPSLFYSSCLFGFLPISFTCCFDSFYLLGFGLCSVKSSSNHSCTASVFNTCKGNLSLNEVYTGSPFMQALGENEAADSFLQWTLKKSAKGNFWGSSCNAHQFPFPRQFQVYRKAIRAAVPAPQGTSRLLRLKWLKNTSVSLHTAGSQGCAVDWSQKMLHHCLAIPQISQKYTEIQTGTISCVNSSGKKSGLWIHVDSSCCFQLPYTGIRWYSLAYRAEKTFSYQEQSNSFCSEKQNFTLRWNY